MKKHLKAAAAILLAISVTTGCKKAEDGAPGATGATGATGNSNVMSYTFNAPASSWTYSSPAWSSNLSVPELTADNINTASVQVYFGTAAVADSWTAIPTTFYGSTNNYYMGFVTSVGNVKITWINNGVGSGSEPNSYFGSAAKYKVVLIPPAMITANPDLNFKNYEQVKAKFNLKD